MPLNEKDINVFVAEARALALRLNSHLDALQEAGVDCASVIGPPPNWHDGRGPMADLTRVSLVLNFKLARKVEDDGA